MIHLVFFLFLLLLLFSLQWQTTIHLLPLFKVIFKLQQWLKIINILFSSNNLSNTLANDHSNGLPNPLINSPQNTHPQSTFKDPFASSCPIDPSSPLFLHNGDNPGIILVPQPLTRENYTTWSCSMLVALSAKNKLCFIDVSLSKPSVF
jgi:hypothetical protein